MITRTDILNELAETFGYQTFLEIGVQSGVNQRAVNCAQRVGVDIDTASPATFCLPSDEFFAMNTFTYDLIFIDGLHTEDQAYRDVTNALDVLAPNGTICMHDCNPDSEWTQRPIEEFMHQPGERWCGTAWRAFVRLRMTRPDLSMACFDCDEGVGVIRCGRQTAYTRTAPKAFTYADLESDRVEMLNLMPPEMLQDWLQSKRGQR